MYKLFFNNADFEKFAVADLLTRGTQMIATIRAEEDLDLDELKAINVSQKVKAEKVVDPFALSFLSSQMITMGKMSIKDEAQMLISLYEIFLSLAILFGADLKAKTAEVML